MLRQHYGIGVRPFYRFIELLPEIMVIFRRMPQIRRHIQPPSVHVIWRRYPFTGNMHYIFKQIFRTFVIQFGKCVMPPPSVIRMVIRPCFLFVEIKIIMVRAFPVHISPLFVPFRVLINPLSIHPLIKGTTMVKHAIQNDPHTPSMGFRHYFGKQFIACLQIRLVCNTVNIPLGKTVFMPRLQQLPFVHNYFPEMRVYIIIILNIVFMIGR